MTRARIWLLLLFPTWILGESVKVPTEFYGGWAKNNDHPGHAPLINDATFRSICDHVIDQGTEWFDPDKVQQGDTVYLNLWYIRWFHKEVHDRIKHPYILITCDVGDWHPEPIFRKLLYDPKLAAWFCRNTIFSDHPKIFQIPMGQTDRYFGDLWLPKLKELSSQKPFEKKHLLYMNHFPREFGDRIKIIKLFEREPYCFSRNHTAQPYSHIPTEDYYRELAASTFVISPIGLETDCVRTWEALALDCIPIVEHSFLDPLFEDMPVLLIHDWEEINERFLKEKHEELKDKRWDKAYFDVWRDQIEETQEKIKSNDLTASQLEAMKWSPQELSDFIGILEEDENPFLSYKGFLTAVHSLQIANAAPFLSKIYLCDPWLHQETPDGRKVCGVTFDELKNYLKDLSLLQEKNKIVVISEDQFSSQFVNYNPFAVCSSPVFLDLSYYRSSLLPDFFVLKDVQNFQHNLKNDLEDLYRKITPGTLLFGNGIGHPYVREALERLSKKHGLNVGEKGSFWFLRRESDPFTLQDILPDPYPEVYEKIELLPFNPQGRCPHRSIFKTLVENYKIKNIVEIGSWLGCSTRHLAELIPDGGKVYAVDHWLESSENGELYQQFLSNVVHAKLTHKIVPVRMDSLAAAVKMKGIDLDIDLIYIDASHDCAAVYQALCAWYPFVEEKGVICGDGFGAGDGRRAVVQFVEKNRLNLSYRGEFWMLNNSHRGQ